MKRINYLVVLLTSIVLSASCGESLEDTYSDYAGNGKIRYPAKCSGLEVTVGWKRLELKWNNGIDAVTDKIKVSWSASDVQHDSLLDRSATSCDLRDLKDGTYRLDVRAVDKNGNESLVITDYARPYTEDHEAVRTFTRAITKFYKVKNNLIFFMDQWNDNIVDIKLNYTDTRGKKQPYPLTEEKFNEGFIVLKDVDTRQPITIDRLGKLEGCPDIIRFEPVLLGNERTFSSDFKSAIRQRYGYNDQNAAEETAFRHFIDTVRTLEFDYDATTFEDVLYCPRLERLLLGKNRYLYPDPAYSTPVDNSILYEKGRSLHVLDVANKLTGLNVERYHNHYFGPIDRTYIREMGYPDRRELDRLPYISQMEVDTIKCSVPDSDSDMYLTDLLDNDPNTWWESSVSPTTRAYELTIVLKEVKRVRGIKIAQMLFDPAKDRDSPHYLPPSVIVKTSTNQIDWKNVTYMEENILGKGSGEVTLLPVAEGSREVRYIKVILHDEVNKGIFRIKLADIVVYQ
ncbi:DUF4998 domain-containing protein [uncultured Sanguibacteroides sp.]|uniref:DUF4998 domain-containing protein n=1 Tax=uncultured Sanguibacteroides sp. TaxID=1635151 RepID=UPI0025D7B1A6|nr:DUF4998 domain-containing protein [uncultured Sanguibacteroides sp.]